MKNKEYGEHPELVKNLEKFETDQKNYDVPTGWLSILNNLFEELNNTNPEYSIKTVKIKEGNLKFSYHLHKNSAKNKRELDEIIKAFNEKLSTTCSNCGKEAELRDSKTLNPYCLKCSIIEHSTNSKAKFSIIEPKPDMVRRFLHI